jgi:hypothetical protein
MDHGQTCYQSQGIAKTYDAPEGEERIFSQTVGWNSENGLGRLYYTRKSNVVNLQHG